MTFEVTVQINPQELEKLVRKRVAGGRAVTTGVDVVEAALSDALKHLWIVDTFTVAEVPPGLFGKVPFPQMVE